MKRPAPLADLMAAIFRGKPAEKRLEEGRIWLVWDAAVGRQIAAKARPVSFRDGTLTVAVVSAPWMQQLTFLKKGILEKLNERLGRELVCDIFLKAGAPDAPAPAAKLSGQKTRTLNAHEKQRINEETAAIPDPELRENIASLFAKHLSSSKGSRQTE